jgi:RimJ/RimL family protein N-acetyltransferase
VLAWGNERRRRHLFWLTGQTVPSGYAELNEMPGPARQMWVGHFLVNPKLRMRGLGTRFATALVMRAFVEFGVVDVLLVVFPENAGAIRCYERAGLVVLGKEKKHFESTGREHMFLRMGIGRRRFTKLASKGLLPTQPVPYQELPS